jgi:hypothetical protein
VGAHFLSCLADFCVLLVAHYSKNHNTLAVLVIFVIGRPFSVIKCLAYYFVLIWFPYSYSFSFHYIITFAYQFVRWSF